MRRPIGRRERIAVVMAALAVAAAGTLVSRQGETAASPTLELTGNLQPVKQINLDFGVGGIVHTLNVKPGQVVEAGTVLASLDTAALETALRQAQDGLSSAQAKLSLDQNASPSAASEAAALGAVAASQAQLAAAQTALGDAQAVNQAAIGAAQQGLSPTSGALAASQAQLDAALANLNDTRLFNATSIAGAVKSLQAQADAAQAAVNSARAQADIAQTNLNDTRRVNQANVATAQASLDGSRSSLTAAQRTLASDQAILKADTTTMNAPGHCGAPANPTVCATDRQIVAQDRQRVAADQTALASAQAGVEQNQRQLSQVQASSNASNDQAQAQLDTALLALQNAVTARDDAVALAQNALTQTQARAQASNDQAQAAVNGTGIARQAGVAGLQGALQQAQLSAKVAGDQAQAQLRAAEVAAQNAVNSAKALHAPPAVQAILIDQAQTDGARTQVELARHNLAAATLVAPVHATVEQVSFFEGQRVDAPTTATHAIVLSNPDGFQITAQVRDTQIRRVKVGDAVTVVAAGAADKVYGKITEVAPAATIRAGVATFSVTAVVEDPNHVADIRPGMSARMTVSVG